ncbi:hypothetical protein FKM82_017565 [Ascaphus truei]
MCSRVAIGFFTKGRVKPWSPRSPVCPQPLAAAVPVREVVGEHGEVVSGDSVARGYRRLSLQYAVIFVAITHAQNAANAQCRRMRWPLGE